MPRELLVAFQPFKPFDTAPWTYSGPTDFYMRSVQPRQNHSSSEVCALGVTSLTDRRWRQRCDIGSPE